MIMTFDELVNKTEKFLERVQQEELEYFRIEAGIEKLRSEFDGKLGNGILSLEESVVDNKMVAVDILIENFIKELRERS